MTATLSNERPLGVFAESGFAEHISERLLLDQALPEDVISLS